MNKIKKVLLLPGDGIGPEVTAQSKNILELISDKTSTKIEFIYSEIGGCAIDLCDNPFPKKTSDAVDLSDAVLLGAIGGYKWDSLPSEKKPEKGLLGLREYMGVYTNLRPAYIFDALIASSSLKEELVKGMDILIVRELTGGIYFGKPRGIEERDGEKVGYNTEVYSESEIRRIAISAFKVAQKRKKKLTSIDKANVLESSILWREVVNSVSKDFPDVQIEHMYVDNAAMQLIKDPNNFDVIVTNNIFGDILSDLAAQIVSSIGLLSSACLRDDSVGLYEPIHGSAPDIANQDKANPIACILSAAMLLRHSLDDENNAIKIEESVKSVINKGYRTIDIANKDTKKEFIVGTSTMGKLIYKELESLL
jgi:3-isopropylmalate dehydrogenase